MNDIKIMDLVNQVMESEKGFTCPSLEPYENTMECNEYMNEIDFIVNELIDELKW